MVTAAHDDEATEDVVGGGHTSRREELARSTRGPEGASEPHKSPRHAKTSDTADSRSDVSSVSKYSEEGDRRMPPEPHSDVNSVRSYDEGQGGGVKGGGGVRKDERDVMECPSRPTCGREEEGTVHPLARRERPTSQASGGEPSSLNSSFQEPSSFTSISLEDSSTSHHHPRPHHTPKSSRHDHQPIHAPIHGSLHGSKTSLAAGVAPPNYNATEGYSSFHKNSTSSSQHLGQRPLSSTRHADVLRADAFRLFAAELDEQRRRHTSAASDDGPRKWRKRKHCIALVVFVVAINLGVVLVRQLGGLPGMYEYDADVHPGRAATNTTSTQGPPPPDPDLPHHLTFTRDGLPATYDTTQRPLPVAHNTQPSPDPPPTLDPPPITGVDGNTIAMQS